MPAPNPLQPANLPARVLRLACAALLMSLMSIVAACAAPPPGQATQGSVPAAATQAKAPDPDASRQAPPMSDPLPPVRKPAPTAELVVGADPDPAADASVNVDFSCTTDADCTVKNVGNCCGYYPRCVNKDSPTDPQAVQAQCAKSGMVSVCGFPAIGSCQCVQGSCEGSNAALIPQS